MQGLKPQAACHVCKECRLAKSDWVQAERAPTIMTYVLRSAQSKWACISLQSCHCSRTRPGHLHHHRSKPVQVRTCLSEAPLHSGAAQHFSMRMAHVDCKDNARSCCTVSAAAQHWQLNIAWAVEHIQQHEVSWLRHATGFDRHSLLGVQE